ncbi:hypothetical protein T484DRAFT_1982251, partial [Baffinella frigidus]
NWGDNTNILAESANIQNVESRCTHAQRVLENYVELSSEEGNSFSSDAEYEGVPDLVPGPDWGNPRPVNIGGG